MARGWARRVTGGQWVSPLAVGAFLAFAVSPVSALAQGVAFEPYGEGFPVGDLRQGILGIVVAALLLVGVLALAFLVYGGFRYIVAATTGRGEREVQVAKQIISSAIIGIVIIGLAYAIVRFVFASLGAA